MNRILLLALMAVLALPAQSATLLWTINGATFDDGGTITGSFGYDVDTNTFSSVNVATTLGSSLPGVGYTSVNLLASSNIQMLLITSPLGPGLTLSFSSGLSNFGGTVPLISGAEGTCADTDCGGLNGPLRFLTAGEVQADGASVPEPSTWMLLLSAFPLLGWSRWRSRASQAQTLASRFLLLAAALTLAEPSASAQAVRTWVSGVGDDANPCSRTAPCKTFPGAISKTAAGGEISVLDAGSFGAVTITKSITINGRGVVAGISASSTNGIIINNVTGVPMAVNIRNLDLIGLNGLNGILVVGAAPTSVVVENLRISGFNTTGIDATPSAGGNINLSVKSTLITNSTGSGINADATNGPVNVLLDGVTINGVATGLNVNAGARATARSSDLSQNTTGAASNGAGSIASLDSGNIAQCTTAVNVLSAGAIARLSNMTIMDNTTGISITAGGTVVSFNNNRIKNNTTNGAPNSVQLQN